jgi:hypothetical protein
MDDYGDYRAWLTSVGLSLLNDEPADPTSLDLPDYPDYGDDAAPMAGELIGLPSPDDDRDPTLRLLCSICGASFSACECLGGPKKLWTPGPLPFEGFEPERCRPMKSKPHILVYKTDNDKQIISVGMRKVDGQWMSSKKHDARQRPTRMAGISEG